MKRRVRLLHAAEADLTRLADFLIEVNPGAAEKIGELLERAVLSLDEFSERAPANADGSRTLTVRYGSGGYAIFYRVLAKEVVVTRIFHPGGSLRRFRRCVSPHHRRASCVR